MSSSILQSLKAFLKAFVFRPTFSHESIMGRIQFLAALVLPLELSICCHACHNSFLDSFLSYEAVTVHLYNLFIQ